MENFRSWRRKRGSGRSGRRELHSDTWTRFNLNLDLRKSRGSKRSVVVLFRDLCSAYSGFDRISDRKFYIWPVRLENAQAALSNVRKLDSIIEFSVTRYRFLPDSDLSSRDSAKSDLIRGQRTQKMLRIDREHFLRSN